MVSFSGTFAQVVKTTGALWAWGLAENGELGDGVNTTEAITPILIGSATDWAFVETGNHFAIAITTSGTVWGWGKNDAWGSACGQIGSSTELQRLAPGLISGL
jgi:alpha-tubulin suppressor-like RCC1 family protein